MNTNLPIEIRLFLPEQLAKELEEIAELAGLTPESVVRLALATDVRRWREAMAELPTLPPEAFTGAISGDAKCDTSR